MKYTLFIIGMLVATFSANAQSQLYPQHFDLAEVTLLDSPLKTAMEINDALLLRYDADRLMAPFIRQAGLHQDASSKYYGWLGQHPSFQNWGLDSWSLEGHVGGHYLTALALGYAAATDATMKTQLKERLDYCLAILKDCQDAYASNTQGLKGFIGGQPINQVWTGLYAGDLTEFRKYGGWVPFYCQHKVLAGLRDAYVYTGSELAKELFRGLSDWSVNVVSKLSTGDMQAMLGWEHGGMNETLADAYKLFGDSKYLDAAKKYSHQQMVDGMSTLNKTFLDGKHANTQVPKYIGFERIYQVAEGTATAAYRKAAHNFWTDVTDERTVCIGGNSVDEHFLAAANASRYISNLNGPESCNSNNMLKLSEDLFDETHDAKYADFYEGTMYNHILSTQDPSTGGYVYFTTLRPQGYKIYSQVNQGMWCCVGTGMENHGKYGHFIYTHSVGNDTLFVNLFTASELNSKKFGVKQETGFPYEQRTRLTITKAGTYTIAVRRPSWLAQGASAQAKTRKKVSQTTTAGFYCYTGSWKVGDEIEVSLPMALRIEECPNLPEYIAFKYGPILLAAKTTAASQAEASQTGLAYERLQNEYGGEGRMDHAPGSMASSLDLTTSPLLICERSEVLSLVKPKDLSKLQFTLSAPAPVANASKSFFNTHKTLTLEPFFSLHHARYVIYWYQQNEAAYNQSDMAKEEAAIAELNARTIDYVGTGEQQSEAGHDASYSSGSTKGSYNGEFYRDAQAGGYIQYVLAIPDSVAGRLDKKDPNLSIMCRFTVADRGRQGTIYVEGEQVADITVPASVKGQDSKGFYNVEYKIPATALLDSKGNVKTRLTFRLKASASTLCPGLYYVRLLKDYQDHAYRWRCTDWKTGDSGRVAQSNFTYNQAENTITIKAGTGANNVCLSLDYEQADYWLRSAQKYMVVAGLNLSVTSGKSYLWWLNGINKWSSVAPTTTKTVRRTTPLGKTQVLRLVAWDMTQTGLADNNVGDEFSICQGATIFGLTSSSGTSTIQRIEFVSDLDALIDELSYVPVTVQDISTLIGQFLTGGSTTLTSVTTLIDKYLKQ